MTPRKLTAGALGVAVLVLAVVLLNGGKKDYAVHLRLSDALGLRNGSKVVAGGVTVGRVHLKLDGDAVDARLTIDRGFAPIGKDATAVVTSVNLLGEKSLELDAGNRRDPAPDDFTLPAGTVTPSTDLDQVLDVLDSGTRDRLTILINEAGQAVTGRKADFSQILHDFPTGLVEGDNLLRRVDGDHRTLVDLVAKSDQFVGALTANREQLADTLDEFGRAAETSETRRPQLLQTLRELPGTLRTAQSFLNDLRETTIPLGPAARQLEAVAAPLDQTLAEVHPFTDSAVPTLHRATAAAAPLSKLATRATPVIRQAVPTLQTLASFSTSLAPISTMLNLSADNIVGVASNWAHAIQSRDSLSHVFRAEVAVSPQTAQELVSRLLDYQNSQKRHHAKPAATGPVLTKPTGVLPTVPKLQLPAAVNDPVKKAGAPVKALTDGVTGTVKKAVGGTTGPAGQATDGGQHASDALLDFLLGS